MPIKELIPVYIEVILSWPTAVLVLGFLFVFKFTEEIKFFIKNIRSFKVGPLETSQAQGPTEDVEAKVEKDVNLTREQWDDVERLVENLEDTNKQKESEVEDYKAALRVTRERAENYEFAYLNLALVYNTKRALSWFEIQTNKSSTRENFMSHFTLQTEIKNLHTEKDAIFNALLVNELIIHDGGLYRVTEKGERFLLYMAPQKINLT